MPRSLRPLTVNPASVKTVPRVSSKVMSVPSRMMKPAAVMSLTTLRLLQWVEARGTSPARRVRRARRWESQPGTA